MKKNIVIVVLALVVCGMFTYYQTRPADFPHPSVFELDIFYDETVTLGESTDIMAHLTNVSGRGYSIDYEGNFPLISINGQVMNAGTDTSTSTEQFSDGEDKNAVYQFIPEQAGVYEITVTAVFNVNRTSTDVKEYQYHKTVTLTVLQ